jgi:hypothetical protein
MNKPVLLEMTTPKKFRASAARLGILCAALLLCACAAPLSETRRNQIMEQNPELKLARTWCIGRFTIDMPPSAKLYLRTENSIYETRIISGEYGGLWKYGTATIEMPVEEMSLEAFAQKIQARQDELRKAKHTKGEGRLLKTEHPRQDTYVLATWGSSSSKVLQLIEGYKWSNGFVFFIKAEVGSERQSAGIERMLERLEKTRARLANEIPKEDGFCFPGGFLAEEPANKERAQFAFVFDDRPDLTFYVHFMHYPEVEKPLLSRRGGVLGLFSFAAMRIRPLRSGNRSLAGFAGQEMLMTAPYGAAYGNPSGERAHIFLWEYPGDAAWKPFIKFELATKPPISLTNEEATALWDAILNSFRIRPIQ